MATSTWTTEAHFLTGTTDNQIYVKGAEIGVGYWSDFDAADISGYHWGGTSTDIWTKTYDSGESANGIMRVGNWYGDTGSTGCLYVQAADDEASDASPTFAKFVLPNSLSSLVFPYEVEAIGCHGGSDVEHTGSPGGSTKRSRPLCFYWVTHKYNVSIGHMETNVGAASADVATGRDAASQIAYCNNAWNPTDVTNSTPASLRYGSTSGWSDRIPPIDYKVLMPARSTGSSGMASARMWKRNSQTSGAAYTHFDEDAGGGVTGPATNLPDISSGAWDADFTVGVLCGVRTTADGFYVSVDGFWLKGGLTDGLYTSEWRDLGATSSVSSVDVTAGIGSHGGISLTVQSSSNGTDVLDTSDAITVTNGSNNHAVNNLTDGRYVRYVADFTCPTEAEYADHIGEAVTPTITSVTINYTALAIPVAAHAYRQRRQ
jgi:hypothetical protein